MASLQEADGHLTELVNASGSDRAVAARRSILEGIDTVLHRQKLIKMADSSELGWRVVQEYESHPLADDSDDEKKIHRAQMHADRKVRQLIAERRSLYNQVSDLTARIKAQARTL